MSGFRLAIFTSVIYCYSRSFFLQLLNCRIYLFIYFNLWQVANLLHTKAIKQRRIQPNAKVDTGLSRWLKEETCVFWSLREPLCSSLIIPSSFSSCEMSAAKHHNRRLQSAALLSPPPHSNTFLLDHLIFILEEKRRGSWKEPKDQKKGKETLDEDEREKPNTPSHHQPPLPADDFTGQSGGSGSSRKHLLHTSGNVLTGITRHAILHEQGKRKKNTSSCPKWQSWRPVEDYINALLPICFIWLHLLHITVWERMIRQRPNKQGYHFGASKQASRVT